MYTKTIIITEDMLDGISSGEIVIKCGQWVQYRWLKNKSRWIGVSRSGAFWAVHNRYGKFTKQTKSFKIFQKGE